MKWGWPLACALFPGWRQDTLLTITAISEPGEAVRRDSAGLAVHPSSAQYGEAMGVKETERVHHDGSAGECPRVAA